MIIDNKIEKTLTGPSVFLGITFLTLGMYFILHNVWIFGIPLLIITAFLFFTYSGVEIDTSTRKIKSYYKIFGIFKHGKWHSLNKYLGVTLVPMKKVHTTFSISNRRTSSTKRYFQIYLVNKANKPELAIKRCKTIEAAQDSLDEFSIWLRIPVFSIKR